MMRQKGETLFGTPNLERSDGRLRAPSAHTQERPCSPNSIEEQKNEDGAGNPHPGGLDRPPCGGGVRRRGRLSSQFSDLGAESVGDAPDRANDPSQSGNRTLALVV